MKKKSLNDFQYNPPLNEPFMDEFIDSNIEPLTLQHQNPVPLNSAQSTMKTLIEEIKSGDPSRIMSGVMNLSSELSIAQENSSSNHTYEMLIPPLIECLKMQSYPYILMYSAMCISNIIDLNPSFSNKVVNQNGVQLLCNHLLNIEFLDLIEWIAKALEKISYENPYSVLSGNAFINFLNVFDFVDFSVQKIILRLLTIISKTINSEKDLEIFILPALPLMSILLKYQDNDDKSKIKIESASVITLNICDSVLKLFEMAGYNVKNFNRIFDIIGHSDIISNILEALFIGANSINFNAISSKTWKNLMIVIRYLTKFSPFITESCLSKNIIYLLNIFISSPKISNIGSEEDASTLKEVKDCSIYILDAVLPQKINYSNEALEALNETDRYIVEMQKEKYIKDDHSNLKILNEEILPKLIDIYDVCGQNISKLFTLQSIDKIIHLSEFTNINKYLSKQGVCQLLIKIFSGKETVFYCYGLKLLEFFLANLSDIYYTLFIREGIIRIVDKLLIKEKLLQIKESFHHKNWIILENPYIKGFCAYAIEMYDINPSIYTYIFGDKQSVLKSGKEKKENTLLHKYEEIINSHGSIVGLAHYILYKCHDIKKLVNSQAMIYSDKDEELKVEKELQIINNELNKSCEKEFLRNLFLDSIQMFNNLLMNDNKIPTNFELKQSDLLKTIVSQIINPLDIAKNNIKINDLRKYFQEINLNLSCLFERQKLFYQTLANQNDSVKKTRLVNFIQLLISHISNIEKKEIQIKEIIPINEHTIDTIKPNEKVDKITVIYSPWGEGIFPGTIKLRPPFVNLPIELSKEDPEVCRLHELYSDMNFLNLFIDQYTTINNIEEFLRSKIKSKHDLYLIKGPLFFEELLNKMNENEGDSKIKNKYEAFISYLSGNHENSEGNESKNENNEYSQNYPLGEAENHILEFHEFQEIQEPEKKAEKKGFSYENVFIPLEKPLNTIKNPSEIVKKQTFGIEYIFYYNGYLVEKSLNILEVRKKYSIAKEHFPEDAIGSLLFQIKATPLISKNDEEILEHINQNSQYLYKDLYFEEQLAMLHIISDVNSFANFPCKQTVQLCLRILCFLRRISNNIQVYFPEMSENLVSLNNISEIIDSKFDNIVQEYLIEPNIIMSTGFPPWIKKLAEICKFFFTFQNRNLLFRLSTFEKSRTFYYLTKFLKYKLLHLESSLFKQIKIPKIKIVVTREHILNSAIKVMEKFGKGKNILEFEYINEQGVGLGPTLEFYSLCSTALSKKLEFWRLINNSYYFPSPLSSLSKFQEKDIEALYEFVGTIIAKSLHDDRLFDFPISEIFWEIVLKKELGLYDMLRFDKSVGLLLIDLDRIALEKVNIERDSTLANEEKEKRIKNLKYKNSNIEELHLYFSLPGYSYIPLGSHSNDELVTIYSLKEYIDLVVYTTFYSSIKLQVDSFIKGFNKVFSISNLNIFYSNEIEDIVCGSSSFNWDEVSLRENIIAEHGYTTSSPQFHYLIKYLLSIDDEKKKKFLQYSTGSKRLPFGSFASLNPKLTIVKRLTPDKLNPNDFLPSVMTCQNYLKIPEYSDYESFRIKFEYALKEGQENFILT